MSDTRLEWLIRRDRVVASAALLCITAIAWWYTSRLAAGMEMGGMDMHGWRMISTGFRMAMSPASAPWTIENFVLMFVMWTVMMVGMMTPSIGPVTLLYAGVRRRAISDGKPFASTGWFVSGYLLAWTGFSLVATLAQWLLERATLLSPTMSMATVPLSGALLIVAGLYQWTPLKRLCLAHCQSPFAFLQRHGGFQRDAWKSIALGLRHGTYCLGCCWGLMILLFVGGIMNLVWIAAISALVLVEKVTPAGITIGKIAGSGFVAAGVWLWIG